MLIPLPAFPIRRLPALLPTPRPPALAVVVALDFVGVPEALAAQGVDVGFGVGAREDLAFVAVDGAEVGDCGGGGEGDCVGGGGGGAGGSGGVVAGAVERGVEVGYDEGGGFGGAGVWGRRVRRRFGWGEGFLVLS